MNQAQDLSEAVVIGSVEDVQRFIKEGADVNKRDYSHRIPLDYCVKFVTSCKCETSGKNAVCIVGGKLDTSLLCKNCADRLEKAKVLIESGTNPNNEDRFGWTVVHQCAWNGDMHLLRLCVQKGAKVNLKTKDQRLPVQLAATRGHMTIVRYLDGQSCDLKSLCRLSINEAMGKRRYNRINELPVPPRVKVFLNYSCTYPEFEATLVPPEPWTSEELHSRNISTEQIRQFICENASQEFLEEHREIVGEAHKGGASAIASTRKADLAELIEVFQTMYLWESFKNVKFEEPLARKPRYSMEKLKKTEDKAEEESSSTTSSSILNSFVSEVSAALSRIKIQ